MSDGFKCPECGVTMRFIVNLFTDAPTTMYAELSKKHLRSADVKFMGAGWDTAFIYCPACGHCSSGLKKRVEELTARAEAAEARLEAAKSVIRDVRSALTDFDECSMERAANALEIVLNWEVKSDE